MVLNKILVVEDDLALNAGVCYELDNAGYFTIGAHNCRKALQILENDEIDLALLDVNLPDGSGFDVCRRIKKIRPELPVVFLTANDLEEDQLTGFDLGAEDYITKPFHTTVLLKKLEVVLRRSSRNSSTEETDGKKGQVYDDGFLKIDFETLAVVCNGERLTITPNEYKILKLLVANSGNIVTREIMLERLWDAEENFINDHSLTVTVNRLRGKLEKKEQPYIKTVRGIGYVWNGENV